MTDPDFNLLIALDALLTAGSVAEPHGVSV